MLSLDGPIRRPPSAGVSVTRQAPGRHRRPARTKNAWAHRFGSWVRLGRRERLERRDRLGRRERFGRRDRVGRSQRLGWPRSGREPRLAFGRRGQLWSVVVGPAVLALANDRERNPGPWGRGAARPCSGDLVRHRSDAQVGDGSLQKPNAAAGRLVVGRVARLGASETQSVGHRIGVVTRRARKRQRLVGQVEVAAGASQLEAALPHALRDLQPPAAGRRGRSRTGTGAGIAGDRRRSVGPHDASPVQRRGGTSPGSGSRPNSAARQGGHTHQSGLAGAWRVGSPSNIKRHRPHCRGGGSASPGLCCRRRSTRASPAGSPRG